MVIKEGEKAKEQCFHPILPNTRIMRLLAKTAFVVIPVVSIPKKRNEYQRVGKIARRYNIGDLTALERNTLLKPLHVTSSFKRY